VPARVTRGDIQLALPTGVVVADVSVIHPAAPTYAKTAAVTAGKAAAIRDSEKKRKYLSADPNGYQFVPLSMESFGRLGEPAMQLLNRLSIAATEGRTLLDKGVFVRSALSELSVGLCKGNALLIRYFLGSMARNNGTRFLQGDLVPHADID
jgi:hypothetical protein